MLNRRQIVFAMAPMGRDAYVGKVVAAQYDLRVRRTRIYLEAGGGVMVGEFDHNTGLVSQPLPGQLPVLVVAAPKVRLRVEGGVLIAETAQRRIASVMAVEEVPEVVYPLPVHPELTALWRIGDRVCFTNNDYRNVYVLPARMMAGWVRPEVSKRIRK